MPETMTRPRAGERARVDRPMPRAERRASRWWEPVSRVASALTAAPPPRPAELQAGADESCYALVIDLPDDDVSAAIGDDPDEPCFALVVDVPDDPVDATGGRVLLFPPRAHPDETSLDRVPDAPDARARSAHAHPAGRVDDLVRDETGPVPVVSAAVDGAAPADTPLFDQDTADEADAAPRPEVDPRIRARRVAIRRAEGRRRLRFVIAALTAVTLAVVLVTTHAFGQASPTAPTARPVAVGWILVPAPKGGSGGPSAVVVDGSGTVMQRALLPPAGLPRLAGATLATPDASRIRPLALARVARILPTDLRARAATLGVHKGLVTMGLDKGPEIRFGTPDGLAEKGRTAFAILSALTTSVHYIDVRVPSAPVTG